MTLWSSWSACSLTVSFVVVHITCMVFFKNVKTFDYVLSLFCCFSVAMACRRKHALWQLQRSVVQHVSVSLWKWLIDWFEVDDFYQLITLYLSIFFFSFFLFSRKLVVNCHKIKRAAHHVPSIASVSVLKFDLVSRVWRVVLLPVGLWSAYGACNQAWWVVRSFWQL